MANRDDTTARDWRDSLARGKAEIEAGETVPLKPFLDRLRAGIARMTKQTQKPRITERT